MVSKQVMKTLRSRLERIAESKTPSVPVQGIERVIVQNTFELVHHYLTIKPPNFSGIEDIYGMFQLCLTSMLTDQNFKLVLAAFKSFTNRVPSSALQVLIADSMDLFLIKLLLHPALQDTDKLLVLRIVSDIATADAEQLTSRFAREGLFEQLKDFLRPEKPDELIDESLFLLSNLCLCSTEEAKELLDFDLWDSVVQKLAHGKPLVRQNSMRCIVHILNSAETGLLLRFVQRYEGVVDYLLELLNRGVEAIEIKCILNIISLFLKCERFEAECSSITFGLADRIRSSPHLRDFEQLQAYDNQTIRQLVNEIINTYFEAVVDESERLFSL